MAILPTQGLFIVFEGVDLCGKGEQIKRFRNFIRNSGKISKYLPLIDDREPTFRAKDIVKHLREDTNAFSDADVLADAYIQDRKEHTKLLLPMLNNGYTILEDRYRMSTDAFQSAQGVAETALIEQQCSSFIIPADITFYFRISLREQQQRKIKRVKMLGTIPDKFDDASQEFKRQLIDKYEHCVALGHADPSLYGKVITIDAEREKQDIATDVAEAFFVLYERWRNGDYTPLWKRFQDGEQIEQRHLDLQ